MKGTPPRLIQPPRGACHQMAYGRPMMQLSLKCRGFLVTAYSWRALQNHLRDQPSYLGARLDLLYQVPGSDLCVCHLRSLKWDTKQSHWILASCLNCLSFLFRVVSINVRGTECFGALLRGSSTNNFKDAISCKIDMIPGDLWITSLLCGGSLKLHVKR